MAGVSESGVQLQPVAAVVEIQCLAVKESADVDSREDCGESAAGLPRGRVEGARALAAVHRRPGRRVVACVGAIAVAIGALAAMSATAFAQVAAHEPPLAAGHVPADTTTPARDDSDGTLQAHLRQRERERLFRAMPLDIFWGLP